MIQILEAPRVLDFAFNPVTYKIKVNDAQGNAYASKGESASIFSNYDFQTNDKIILSFTNPSGIQKTIEFTAKNTVSAENEFVADSFRSEIAHIIQAHSEIAPFFNITYKKVVIAGNLFNSLTAETKEIESGWLISWSITTMIFGAATYTTESNPFDEFDSSDLKIRYTVYFENNLGNGNWYAASDGVTYTDSDGSNISIGIGSIIEAASKNAIGENPFSYYNATAHKISDNIRRFYVEFAEIQNDIVQNTIKSDIKSVIIGGIPNHVYAAQNWWLQPFSFLTWQPNGKRIARASTEWITWLNYSGADVQAIIHVKTYNAANINDAVISVPSSSINVKYGQCATFAVSPTALSISSTTKYYTIQVKSDNGNILSPERLYIIDDKTQYRQLAYLNAFGCPETVCCYGDFTEKFKLETLSWTTIRKDAHAGQLSLKQRHAQNYTLSFLYRSGNLTAATKEVLAEIGLSPVLSDITTPQYIALKLTDEKAKEEILKDTNETIFSWEWSTELLLDEQNFAPLNYFRNTDNWQNVSPGGNSNTSILSGLKSFFVSMTVFNDLIQNDNLQVGIYFITDTNPEQVWFSGGGSAAVNITFGPLRYVKMDNFSGNTVTLQGITATSAEERQRMRFYRGNVEIFITDDFNIVSNDSINFLLPFDNETFRAFY